MYYWYLLYWDSKRSQQCEATLCTWEIILLGYIWSVIDYVCLSYCLDSTACSWSCTGKLY